MSTLTPPTPRELEVLKLVSKGLGNRKIAGRLGISIQTTKNHLSALFLKLGANDRAHAVALGLKKKLITHE